MTSPKLTIRPFPPIDMIRAVVEGGEWRPATGHTDAGRLRGGARPGDKQCYVRRGIQPTHSERALLIARWHTWRSFAPNDIRLERSGYHWRGDGRVESFAKLLSPSL